MATLHTWSRTLAFHAHVPCLVRGGGLTVDGSWVAVRTGYLLPVAVVRALFRGQVLGALEELGYGLRVLETRGRRREAFLG